MGKSIPLHVVIEGVGVEDVGVGGRGGRVELDTYAFIPGHSRFSDVLQTALTKLGYAEDIQHARGERG